ncbi:Os07g0454200 [Oryza sativa Japonica Group]|uniref:Os07g0454200 protein n=1 Tax=Oryza sativa subsp. japonica TaxID=39947 RepID=B7EC82_ORYSJ|nr:unnamed protein product [Oryza sativa Japonica Group]BAG90594.1 unnamed protein product [Oryza sativa Japonica Group]BAT01331.1 Os07g0454200 [Oryza sativa Japonica Group]
MLAFTDAWLPPPRPSSTVLHPSSPPPPLLPYLGPLPDLMPARAPAASRAPLLAAASEPAPGAVLPSGSMDLEVVPAVAVLGGIYMSISLSFLLLSLSLPIGSAEW